MNRSRMLQRVPVRVFSPSDIDGLQYWFDASQESYNNNDNVSVLNDFSGNGNNAFANSGEEALFESNIINNKPSIYFTSPAILRSEPFSAPIPQPSTIIVVGKYNVLSENRYFIDGLSDGRNTNGHTGINQNTWALWATGLSETKINTDLNWNIHICTYNGANSKYQVNSIIEAGLDPGTESMTGITIGGRFNENRMTGYQSEIFGYNKQLSNQETEDVLSYLSNKYGITL